MILVLRGQHCGAKRRPAAAQSETQDRTENRSRYSNVWYEPDLITLACRQHGSSRKSPSSFSKCLAALFKNIQAIPVRHRKPFSPQHFPRENKALRNLCRTFGGAPYYKREIGCGRPPEYRAIVKATEAGFTDKNPLHGEKQGIGLDYLLREVVGATQRVAQMTFCSGYSIVRFEKNGTKLWHLNLGGYGFARNNHCYRLRTDIHHSASGWPGRFGVVKWRS